MKNIYFDNAATTQLDPRVLEEMLPHLLENYGNPSSTHHLGRKAKSAIEQARKEIAEIIGAKSARVIFTSGATESNNLVFKFAKSSLGIENIILSPLEHHAVTYAAHYQFPNNIQFIEHLPDGLPNLDQLEGLLAKTPKALVSIMHVNNEVGTVNPIKEISTLCKQYGALFHSDTVQSIAHLPINMENLGIDFMVSSAHKFHGPKGIGFLAFSQDFKLSSDQRGGTQEKGIRAGTENVTSIIGLATALKIVREEMTDNEKHFQKLKSYLITRLQEIEGAEFNVNSQSSVNVLPSILNIALPTERFNEMTLFSLDMAGIAASGGSACASGAVAGSHVLAHFYPNDKKIALRISFSKFNTIEEIDFFVDILKQL